MRRSETLSEKENRPVPEARELDEQVLDWLAPDDRDPASVSQHDAQELAWWRAPGKSSMPEGELSEVAAACARLLERSGRHRAATTLREHTPGVLADWARSAQHGSAACARAMQASGVEPPDTPTLTWAPIVGSEEARAFDAAQRMLESALDEDRFSVGEQNWRAVQHGLVADWLRTPCAAFAGRAPLEVIHAERTADWADAGTPARRRIMRAVLPRFTTRVNPPNGLPADPVPPLRFLLDAVDRGITLTSRDQLPLGFVRDVAERFGWGLPAFIIRKEADVVELGELRYLATRTRLIALRRRHHTLTLTAMGRAALDDPARLWAGAAAGWFEHDDFGADVAEVAAATLLDGPATAKALTTTALEAVAPSFCDRDGAHPDYREVRTAIWEWLRLGHALGWLRCSHSPPEELCRLTESGRVAAVEGLRHRARAPIR